MTERPQQAGQPHDPRERHPERDPTTGSSGDEAFTPEPGVEQRPGADQG